MAGGWNVGPQYGNPQDVGSVTSGGTGLSGVGNNGTAYAKGSWTQVVASTTADTAAIMVQILKTGSIITTAFDIGIGASGSEVAIVSNLSIQNVNQTPVIYFFPVSIRAGTRISTRESNEGTFQNVYYKITLLDDTALSGGVGSAIDTYGFSSTTNTGVAVDAGATASTKGAYSQIAASVTNDLAGFFLAMDTQGRTSGTSSGDTYIDIAIGAAGSEKVILPNTWNYIAGGTSTYFNNTPYFPIPIRAGTRIAARTQSLVTASPDRIIGVTLYGVRQ